MNEGNLSIERVLENGTHGGAVGVGYVRVLAADSFHSNDSVGAGAGVRLLRHAKATIEPPAL
jgi:hypothetical protein